MSHRSGALPLHAAVTALALTACIASPALEIPPPRLDYTVRVSEAAAERVEVELALTGLPVDGGPLTLALPERFAFVALEAPVLEGAPVARDATGRVLPLETETPYRWHVDRGGATEVRVHLAVPLTHRTIPEVRDRDAYEFPYLAADHGMLVAGSMLLAPEGVAGRARVRFVLPSGWEVRCPWPEVEPGVYEPDSRSALQNDLIAVGRWEEMVIDANGCQVTVAVAPGQGDLLAEVGPPIERIVHAEIELFGRVSRPKYLFLFGRPDPPPHPGERGLSLAGSPKNGSMTLMVRGVGMGIDPARDVGHLVAHEFHHTWAVPHVALPDELRFVGEGFTEYYAYLVLAREGMITWREFADALRRKLNDYLSNPSRGELSLVEAGGPRFFAGGAAYSLVYDGGALFAALVDRYIRTGTDDRSLDEVMRAFYNDPRWMDGSANPAFTDFFAVLDDFLPPADVQHLSALARDAAGIDFGALLGDTGASFTARPTPWRAHLATTADR